MSGTKYIEVLFDKVMSRFPVGDSGAILEVMEDMASRNKKVYAINNLLDLKLDILLEELKIQRPK